MTAAGATREILPMFVISKFKQARCFYNIKQLRSQYRNQKISWITEDFFKERVKKLEKTLLVGNYPTHPQTEILSNVNIIFLALNSISAL